MSLRYEEPDERDLLGASSVKVYCHESQGPKSPACAHNDNLSWLALGLSSKEYDCIADEGFSSNNLPRETVRSLNELASESVEFVLVLQSSLAKAFEHSAGALRDDIFSASIASLVVLVPWREPPASGRRDDGEVSSFLCSATIVRDWLRTSGQYSLNALCFSLLKAVLNDDVPVQRLFIRQLPYGPWPDQPPSVEDDGSVIMAHRGPQAYLATALNFIDRAAESSNFCIRIGLDIEDFIEYRALVEKYDHAEFYRIENPPAGPYVIRDWLARRSSEHLLVFQDSDDVSCHDRFARQYQEMAKTGAHLIGCHELSVDEMNRKVRVLRFPLDVSAALSLKSSVAFDKGEESFLHATAMMMRTRFIDAGGFSTDRKIANDTQFLLRAHFSMHIRNIDAFLYIRRIHPTALTVAPETGHGCAVRRSLSDTWQADFEAVKNGKARLEHTSLQARSGTESNKLIRLGNVTP
jgi:hypothetical protein